MELAEWMADASLPQLTLKPAQDVKQEDLLQVHQQ